MSAAPPGPLASPGYWLHHAALTWRAELGRRLRPLGLTPTQFDVLASLGWISRTRGLADGAGTGSAGDHPTQQEVADFAGIDRMMASKVLRVLDDRGLLSRTPDRTDARAYRLRLTAEGRRTVTESTAIARSVDVDLFGVVANVEQLRAALERVAVRPGRAAEASKRDLANERH